MKHLHVFQFQTIPWFGAVSSHVLLYATPRRDNYVRPAQKESLREQIVFVSPPDSGRC